MPWPAAAIVAVKAKLVSSDAASLRWMDIRTSLFDGERF